MVRMYKISYVVDGKVVYSDKVELGPTEVSVLENELGLIVEIIQAEGQKALLFAWRVDVRFLHVSAPSFYYTMAAALLSGKKCKKFAQIFIPKFVHFVH